MPRRLQISDHFALHAAANSHASVVFVYVLDDRAPGIRPLGGAVWLAQSLRALGATRSSMPGMRELWHTGVMHDRVRMVVASFLVKHLLIDWRWPELAQLPDKLIHQPWTATPLELASAGIELGRTYPQPIVDHKAGRERALAAYATIRG